VSSARETWTVAAADGVGCGGLKTENTTVLMTSNCVENPWLANVVIHMLTVTSYKTCLKSNRREREVALEIAGITENLVVVIYK
jgi:hypothetical protein